MRRGKALDALCGTQLIAGLVVVIGFLGPWVAHETAGLTVTGYEMSEFAKFFPQVQSGVVPVRRALFVTPLLAAVISIALVARQSDKGLRFRVSVTVLAGLISLAVLPPHQSILERDYRLQLIIVAVTMLCLGGTVVTPQLPRRVHGALACLVALAGYLPALWQYILFRPLIVDLYQASVPPGWGLIVCGIGLVLLLGTGLRQLFLPDQELSGRVASGH